MPGAFTRARAQRLASGDYSQPSWELAMARKDARLVLGEVEAAAVELALMPALAARMDAMIERGHAHDDWTVIAKDHVG